MALIALRIIFVLITAVVGGVAAAATGGENYMLLGVLAGLTIGGAIIFVEMNFRRITIRGFSAVLIGLVAGVAGWFIFDQILRVLPWEMFGSSESQAGTVRGSISVIIMLICVYLGVVVTLKGAEQFNLLLPGSKVDATSGSIDSERILVDTSVIIDGRVADIAETGFLQGELIIPRFVLRELQTIADSSDPLKRTRGRRGLDILNRIQKDPHIEVRIHETDFPDVSDVDAKLVKLAKVLDAKVFTNDYNLNKVAEFQQVRVLNVNDLANALKPVILPGEAMNVRIVREGKEAGQGVAYLDDGTMVVVNNGRDRIGQKLDVNVTSVLQTSAGRMIFADIKN
ncbi:MAG: TRAM domain-containing protein [Verrucomicrobia bacterium]|nr:TRAM domain-containing protein [Verrucomicrobiota bacterium]